MFINSYIFTLAVVKITQGARLMEENRKLKQKVICYKMNVWCFIYVINKLIKWQMLRLSNERIPVLADSDVGIPEEGGVSSESAANVCSCNSGPPADEDSSDTSLKLGWVFLLLLVFSINSNIILNYNIKIFRETVVGRKNISCI